MHGRPRALAGRYYSSLFIHYKPVDWALTLDDAIVRVPPHWLERGAEREFPKLAIRGTRALLSFCRRRCARGASRG